MNILTWNIQATKGCDGRYDAPRIVNHLKKYGDLDVICLQEVSKHIPDLNSDDQPSLIGHQFPGYEAIWAPGFSVPGASANRREFGNLTFVKRRLLKNSRVHNLPSPSVKEPQIPRTMVEVVVGGDGDFQFTIFNTHLAFHSSLERIEQVQALTRLRDQIIAKANSAKASESSGPYKYTDESHAVILCGDLNVGSDSNEFIAHITDQEWVDCWAVQRSINDEKRRARSPTCGCFDRVQWPEGPHVRDYFLVTPNLAEKAIRVEVDVETNASDHQPVFLEISL